jgi:hypothetical protein
VKATACNSVSRHESVSATTLAVFDLYSGWKSNPSNLLAHLCCGIVDVLIDQELEVVVVHADEERPAPKVRPPVANCLNKANEFTLVSYQLGMSTHNRSIEECHHTIALMYYGVESGA